MQETYFNPTSVQICYPHDDGKPFDQWVINIIGPMPPNKQNKKFIILQLIFVRIGQSPNLQKPMM